MRLPLTLEQKLVLASTLILFVIPAVPTFALPLTPGDRAAMLFLLLVEVGVGAYIFYRASRPSWRGPYPLALLGLGLNLPTIFILHRYFPTIDLLVFITIAGTGAVWGFQPGLSLGVAAAVGYTALILIVEPFSALSLLSAAIFDLHLIFVGGLTGLLSTQQRRRRAQIEKINAQNTRLAQALQQVNAALEARVAASDTEVRQAQLLQEELSAMVTHDLKSPLGTIISALLILRDTLPPEALNEHQAINAALKAGDRQLELIENLLDVQRLRSGALPLNFEQLELGAVLQEVVEQFEPRAKRKSIQLEKNFEVDLPPVRTDRQVIVRVISNLLENAYKFTPSNGRIMIGAEAQASMLRVSVSDTGPGVPGPHRQAIFEKYRQAPPGDSAARDGIGLGLAFCKMAVRALGGDITVGPSHSGGARFDFTLPLAHPK